MIASWWDVAHAACPDVAVERAAYEVFVQARPNARPEHAEELLVACGCLAHDAAALAAFEARFLARVETYLGSLARSVDVDEVRQALAIKLLVGTPEQPPRLARYAGEGSLEGWIRVAACRLAIELTRARRHEPLPDTERLAELASRELDGELAELRDRYRTEFSAAMHDALTALDGSHRALLRLHYLEGATTAALAALYRVSRNTMVRRIADARTALFEATLRGATARLGLPAERYHTLLEMMRSHLDISIARLLAEPAP